MLYTHTHMYVFECSANACIHFHLCGVVWHTSRYVLHESPINSHKVWFRRVRVWGATGQHDCCSGEACVVVERHVSACLLACNLVRWTGDCAPRHYSWAGRLATATAHLMSVRPVSASLPALCLRFPARLVSVTGTRTELTLTPWSWSFSKVPSECQCTE